MTTAKELYEALVQQIEADCAAKSFEGCLNLCEAEGMQGGERKYGAIGQQYVYELEFSNGDKVEFEFKWYDQSKAFSIQPDIHKFYVSYTPKDGMPLAHSNAYEE